MSIQTILLSNIKWNFIDKISHAFNQFLIILLLAKFFTQESLGLYQFAATSALISSTVFLLIDEKLVYNKLAWCLFGSFKTGTSSKSFPSSVLYSC